MRQYYEVQYRFTLPPSGEVLTGCMLLKASSADNAEFRCRQILKSEKSIPIHCEASISEEEESEEEHPGFGDSPPSR